MLKQVLRTIPRTLVLLILLYWQQSEACQAGCGCEPHELGDIINCRHKGLEQVPSFTPTSTNYYELTLAENDITTIPSRAFEGLKIKKLDVSANRITSIALDAFDGIESTLTELILEVNDGIDFPIHALAVLTKLTHITLKGFNTPSLPNGALDNLVRIQNLTLLSCNIDTIRSSDLASFAGNLRSLKIEDNNMNSFPTEALTALTNLESLSFKHNTISSLPDNGMENLGQLLELDISSNSLSSFDTNAFRGLDSLQSLSLQVNRLNYHVLAPLSALTTLRELNLGYQSDQLNQLPNGLFTNMNNLEMLNLPGNQLTSLNAPMFNGLSALRTLLLAENGIRLIDTRTFADMHSLEHLNLDQQNLEDLLSEGTFAGLEDTLTTLSLKRVKFNTANWPAISPLRSLVSLDLMGNSLPFVPAFALERMSKLQSLNLENNNIHNLTQDMLHGPEGSLQVLNLNQNQLNTLPYCSLHAHTELTTITLNQNPLNCDCRLRWLHRWVKQNKGEYHVEGWFCDAPESLSGQLFTTLSEDQLVCDPPRDPSEDICNTYTTTTSTTTVAPTTPPRPVTTEPVYPDDLGFHVNFADIDVNSVRVRWTIEVTTNLRGFVLEYRKIQELTYIETFPLTATDRSKVIDTLISNTQYMVCVTAYGVSEATDCESFTTLNDGNNGDPSGQTDKKAESSGLTAILGAILGAIAVLTILAAVAFLLYRKRNNKPPFGPATNKPPQVLPVTNPAFTDNSQRFSRPANIKNPTSKDIEAKLDGFTPEERDRILQMLNTSQSKGSTMSVISGAPGMRYVPEPTAPINNETPYEGYLTPSVTGGATGGVPGNPYEGYLNPAMQYSPEHNIYQEIPEGATASYEDLTHTPGLYQEIPHGATSSYDNINALGAAASYDNINTLDPQPSTSTAPDPPPSFRECHM